MGGSLEFVPGTLAKPEGPPFWVRVPRFAFVSGEHTASADVRDKFVY